jgi:uncharacterized protein YbaA (DUF1428 family)
MGGGETKMSKYVDGFVIPVPAGNIEKYRTMSQKAGEIWKEYGALQYFECVADDLDHENMVSFRKISGAQDDETVIFAWIVFESREHRDEVNAKVMQDPRISEEMKKGDEPFDFKRMAYGGFRTIVEL